MLQYLTRLLRRSFTGPRVVVQLHGSQRHDTQAKALLPSFNCLFKKFPPISIRISNHTLPRWIEGGMHPYVLAPTPINIPFDGCAEGGRSSGLASGRHLGREERSVWRLVEGCDGVEPSLVEVRARSAEGGERRTLCKNNHSFR
jgi:hypothetical protein